MKTRRGSWTRFTSHLATKARKKLRLRHSLNELDPDLAGRELLFQAPSLTPDLVDAVRKISPQFRFSSDEHSRRFWELNQNGLCWGEYLALTPVLDNMPQPCQVLDIGPGMGRSVIFFKRKLDWQQALFHLYDSTGSKTKYTRAGPRFEDSFCGDLNTLGAILEHNGIERFEIFDAVELDFRLDRLPGPYDFIYSFFAVGFHWSIEHFLDEILGLMHADSIGAFTLHDKYDGIDQLEGVVPFRVVEFKKSWPRDRWTRMLVLSKNPELLKRLD